MFKGFITVTEAAERYGLSSGRIRQLLLAGRLKGRKFGHTWAVSVRSLDGYKRFPQKAKKTGAKTLDI